MKYLFLVLGLLLSANGLNAQIQKLEVHRIVSSYQLDLAKDALKLSRKDALPLADNKLLAVDCLLKENELLLNYQLDEPGPKGYYIVSLEIAMDGQKLKINPAYLLGDLGKTSIDGSKEKQIIWTNLTEELSDAKGEIQISLEVEWWGLLFLAYKVDCNKYPAFEFGQQAPYFAGGLGGLGCIAAGIILVNNADTDLQEHLLATTLAERSNGYDDYVNKLRTAEIVTYIGVGIIALDALFFVLRKEKHKKRIRVFEEHCKKQSLSIEPFWEPSIATKQHDLGLNLSFHF